MGCFLETAKQGNQCGINKNSSSSNNNDNINYDNNGNQQITAIKTTYEYSQKENTLSNSNNSDDDKSNKNKNQQNQQNSTIKDNHQQSSEKAQSTITATKTTTILTVANSRQSEHQQRHNSYESVAAYEAGASKPPSCKDYKGASKNNKSTNTNSKQLTLEREPIDTNDLQIFCKNCRPHEARTSHTPPVPPRPTTPHTQHERRCNSRVCCRYASRTARSLAAGMAAACSDSGHNIHEMVRQARQALTAHVASVGSSLIEHIGHYAAEQRAYQQQLPPHKRHQQRKRQQSPPQQASYCQQQHCQQHVVDASEASYAASSAAAAAYNYIGHNYYHLLRNSISFYAASSVILVLCYLTSTTSAAATNSEAAPLDKHPIIFQGIDWSKFDESSSDKEILDLLLEKKRYDKRLLPPVNDEDFCCGLSSPDMAKNQNTRRPHNRGTLTVNVNVLLLSLASPDESSLKYEVEFLLNQQWNDPRLQYGNKSHYDFLNALHHHDSIWTPDTYFIMHGDFKDPIIPMHFALRIYRNGTITYAMRRHLILSCQGSLHIFPFDDPKCSFSMESISYEEAQIKYVWKNDEDTLRKSPSLTTLNAYLIKNQTTACDQNSWRGNYSCLRVDLIFTRDRAFYFTTVFIPGIILVTSSFITFWLEWNAVPARSMIGNYSCLQVELTFTRDRAYYFTTVFIPGIILVTSSFITFWLEWNAVPARVMIGVTTMLNFFTTSNGFRSTLPVVSNLTAMNVWDGVCMCFIYASLLEFVCVNYVGRKRPLHNVVYRPGENPVTQRLPAVLSRIGVILASPLEIIEREFHAALSSEKAAAGGVSSTGTSTATTPLPMPSATRIRWEEQHGGIIGAAVQNLRARSIKRKSKAASEAVVSPERSEPIYTEPLFVETPSTTASRSPAVTTVTLEDDPSDAEVSAITASTELSGAQLRRSRSMSTNTPALILRSENTRVDVHQEPLGAPTDTLESVTPKLSDLEMAELQLPQKPPRKKSSRSTSPAALYEAMQHQPLHHGRSIHFAASASNGFGATTSESGEKRREAGAPNEIVACTTCGGSSSPCTHSANNGCATETCFVQVRKKEPPHPIRVAKTIDVIARITFPTAYAIFLIFFFVHYKGFS